MNNKKQNLRKETKGGTSNFKNEVQKKKKKEGDEAEKEKPREKLEEHNERGVEFRSMKK